MNPLQAVKVREFLKDSLEAVLSVTDLYVSAGNPVCITPPKEEGGMYKVTVYAFRQRRSNT